MLAITAEHYKRGGYKT